MAKTFSVLARRMGLYITNETKTSIELGLAKDRIVFYDENDAENVRAKCDDMIPDCFQVVTE